MMDNKIINMVSEHKHLGLTISDDGNWDKHVDLITKKADFLDTIMLSVLSGLNLTSHEFSPSSYSKSQQHPQDRQQSYKDQ
jgi:hypothetical protein